MKALIDFLLRQPITIAVGTMLAVFTGILAITRVPVRMTPEVSSVVIAVTTNWENASSEEIESDIVEEQEKVLGEITGLKSMISTSAAGQGTIRLEFETGTDIAEAQDEVLQKLDEVPGYPDGVLQPVVEDIDPESADYIAWIGLFSTDPDFDPGAALRLHGPQHQAALRTHPRHQRGRRPRGDGVRAADHRRSRRARPARHHLRPAPPGHHRGQRELLRRQDRAGQARLPDPRAPVASTRPESAGGHDHLPRRGRPGLSRRRRQIPRRYVPFLFLSTLLRASRQVRDRLWNNHYELRCTRIV